MNIKIDSSAISLNGVLRRFVGPSLREVARPDLSLRAMKAARVRLSIVGAVAQLTRERPLADIAVREICDLAQVAPATFFNYFPSKEDVLVYYMRLWSIPVTLLCRAAVERGGALDAITIVFDYTAGEMEQDPRLMLEMIAYIAQAQEPPRPLSISRAERLLAFPDLPEAAEVEPQTLDDLFTSLLQQALRTGDLAPALSLQAVVLLLKTIFYGVPLAARRESGATIRQAYHEVLAVLLAGLKPAEKRGAHEAEPHTNTV